MTMSVPYKSKMIAKMIEYQLSETRKEIAKIEQALCDKPNDKLNKDALKKVQEEEYFIQKLQRRC
jgi:hypothetical protein